MGLKCKHFLVNLVLLIALLQKPLVNNFPKARQNALQEKHHPRTTLTKVTFPFSCTFLKPSLDIRRNI